MNRSKVTEKKKKIAKIIIKNESDIIEMNMMKTQCGMR